MWVKTFPGETKRCTNNRFYLTRKVLPYCFLVKVVVKAVKEGEHVSACVELHGQVQVGLVLNQEQLNHRITIVRTRSCLTRIWVQSKYIGLEHVICDFFQYSLEVCLKLALKDLFISGSISMTCLYPHSFPLCIFHNILTRISR